MKKTAPNPEIIKTKNGVLIAYEFRIPPINVDGSFHVGKTGLLFRTMVFEFDTEVYAFGKDKSFKTSKTHNLLDFKINEKPIDHLSKHIIIEFGNTTFETVGNYTLNMFENKKSDLDLKNMKSNDPSVSLF